MAPKTTMALQTMPQGLNERLWHAKIEAMYIIRQLERDVGTLKTDVSILKTKVANLTERHGQISTRDLVKNVCFESDTVCTIDPVTNKPKLYYRGKSKGQARDTQYREDANYDAHWASVEDAYIAIEKHLERTRENFLRNAKKRKDEEEQRVIEQCTLEDIQRLIVFVSPKEYQAMSGTSVYKSPCTSSVLILTLSNSCRERTMDCPVLYEPTGQSLDERQDSADFKPQGSGEIQLTRYRGQNQPHLEHTSKSWLATETSQSSTAVSFAY